jgi:hypothetical protein
MGENNIMKKIISITMFFLFTGIFNNIVGFETEWYDPKSDDKTTSEDAGEEESSSILQIEEKIFHLEHYLFSGLSL